MEILFLIGRVIFGMYWVSSGMNHFMRTQMLAGYAQSVGVPSPKFGTLLTGAMMIAGGVLILLGVYIEIAVGLLVLFLLMANFMVHKFWNVSDPQAKMNDQINFMKNMALVGALLMLLMVPHPWMYSI